MRHPVFQHLPNLHIPSNPDFAVQNALATVLREIQDDIQYGSEGPEMQRMERLETCVLLLVAHLEQQGVI